MRLAYCILSKEESWCVVILALQKSVMKSFSTILLAQKLLKKLDLSLNSLALVSRSWLIELGIFVEIAGLSSSRLCQFMFMSLAAYGLFKQKLYFYKRELETVQRI